MSTIKLNKLIPANAGVFEQVSQSSGDNGTLIKRFQTIDGTTGDVLQDAAEETSAGHGGNAQTGSSTTITLNAGANATDDFYNGWWIYLTSGTGNGQVRRIKDYVGSTQVATVYNTADAVDDGLDFAVAADSTTLYSLYNRTYVGSFYDESVDEWVIGFLAEAVSNLTIQKTADFRVNNIKIDGNYLGDTNSLEALLVRKEGDTGDILKVDTTNSQINLGPGTSNSSTLLSLYGTSNSADLGPHFAATTTDDIYPVFQQLNYAHDNIAFNFDSYWGAGWVSSDIGSNFQIYKNTDLLNFNFATGIAQGATITWGTALTINTSGIVNFEEGIIVDKTSTEAFLVRRDSDGGDIFTVDTTDFHVKVDSRFTIDDTNAQALLVRKEGDSGDIFIVDTINSDVEILGGTLNLSNATSNFIEFSAVGSSPPAFITRSTGTKLVLYPTVSGGSSDYAIGIEGFHVWNSVPELNSTYGFKWYGATTQLMRLGATGELLLDGNQIIDNTSTEAFLVRKDADGGDIFIVDTTNSDVEILGGTLTLSNATSNWINYGVSTEGAPTFTTRSVGTKVILSDSLSGGTSDYAIGIESGHLWNSVPTTVGHGFKWYAGTTLVGTLTSTGALTVSASIDSTNNITTQQSLVSLNVIASGVISTSSTTDSTSSITGALRTSGGAGIAKNLYVGGLSSFTTIPSGDSAVLSLSNATPRDDLTTGVLNVLRLYSEGSSGVKWSSVLEVHIGTYEADVNSRSRADFKMTNGGTITPEITVMTMTANGRIGIGSTTPAYPLDVVGDFRTSGNAYLSGTVVDTTSTEALIVRKDSDGGDIFTVDTSTNKVIVNSNAQFTAEGTSFLGDVGTSFLRITPSAGENFIQTGISEVGGSVAPLKFTGIFGSPLLMTIGTTGVDISNDLNVNGNILVDNTSTEALLVRKNADGGDVFIVDTTNSIVNTTTILPLTAETYDLGSAAAEFNNIYSQNAVTVSDRNKKENIEPERFGLDFVNQLNPVEFNYKSNGSHAHGLISQEVEELLVSQGIETQEFYSKQTKDDTTSYHINYTHLIGPLIKSIQELSNRNSELEQRLQVLENK